jgi:molybdopterin/thiamine biosynthesis adenylyltransferase/rhodanese-related sulfurtransferase
VLIIGLGGLGSPAALYLAGAGVGTLGFMDSDAVEVSNLHRQIVHTEAAARAGLSKVRSAAATCKALNSEVRYVCHEEQATGANILATVSQYDLVLDCTDNPATRYLISDACVILGKVLVSGAAQRGEGMLIVLNSPPAPSPLTMTDKGPCYRCVFPRPPAPETVRSCSEIGILGPVVGTIGTLMAGEAIKLISTGAHLPPPLPPPSSSTSQRQDGGIITPSTVPAPESGSRPPERAKHTMLLYNTWAADPRSVFRTITLRGRRKDCLACGDDETLAQKNLGRITADVISEGRLDYQAFCGVAEDVRLLGEENRIDAREFLQEHARQHHGHHHRHHGGEREKKRRKRKHIVVDVREEHEFELGSKVSGSVNIPLSKILRHGDTAFDQLQLELEPGLGSSTGFAAQPGPGIGPDGGTVDQESHIPTAGQETANGAGLDPQGGQINKESHIPTTTEATVADFPSGPNRDDLARQNPTTGPDGGMLNRESHIQTKHSYPGTQESGPDGGMLNPESHIPVAAQPGSSTSGAAAAAAGPDGGMVDHESHIPIPVARQSTFSSADFPPRPSGTSTKGNESDKYSNSPGGDDNGNDVDSADGENNDDDDDDDNLPAVYFVCQRGNDSQIAAQKLMTRIQVVGDTTGRGTATGTAENKAERKRSPWIGDIKGGFLALERHATY